MQIRYRIRETQPNLSKRKSWSPYRGAPQNTELTHNDRVLFGCRGKGERGTGFTTYPSLYEKRLQDRTSARRTRVAPLRGVRGSHLLSMSSEGEAVLPYTIGEGLEIGDEIILNSTVDRIPEGWIVKQIREQMED